MKKLLLVAAVGFAAEVAALPPVVPTRMQGKADISIKEQACVGSMPFLFESSNLGNRFRVMLTSPPCISAFNRSGLFSVQPTALGSLWIIPVRSADVGNDEGLNLHLFPADPSVQQQMAWGDEERATYKATSSWLDETHLEIRFRLSR